MALFNRRRTRVSRFNRSSSPLKRITQARKTARTVFRPVVNKATAVRMVTKPAPRPMRPRPMPRNSGIVPPSLPKSAPRPMRPRPVIKVAPKPTPAPAVMPVADLKPAPRPMRPRRFPIVKPKPLDPRTIRLVRPTPKPVDTPRNSGIVPPSLPKQLDPRVIRTVTKPAVIAPDKGKGIVPPSLPVVNKKRIKRWDCDTCNTKPALPSLTPAPAIKVAPAVEPAPAPLKITSKAPSSIEDDATNAPDPAEKLIEAQEKGIAPDLLKPQAAKTAGSGVFAGIMALLAGGYFLFGGKDTSKKASLNGPSDAPKSQKHLKMNL